MNISPFKKEIVTLAITFIVAILIIICFPKEIGTEGGNFYIPISSNDIKADNRVEKYSCIGIKYSISPNGCWDCGNQIMCAGVILPK